MKRLTLSTLFMLFLTVLGTGCRKQGNPKMEKATASPPPPAAAPNGFRGISDAPSPGLSQ